jgi:tRNA-uridine 2-sulfurtransferase
VFTVAAQADGTVHVAFDELQRAITLGQAAVFYSGEECIDGGTIEVAHKIQAPQGTKLSQAASNP